MTTRAPDAAVATGTVILGSPDLAAFCGTIMDAAAQALGADCASIQAKIPAKPVLQLIAARGFVAEATAYWQQVDAGSSSSCGQALRRGQRIVIPDVERDQLLAGTEDLHHMRLCGIRAVQSTPLFSRSGEPVGMISTHWRREHLASPDTLRFVDAMALHFAELIERVSAQEALRLRVAALERADREKNKFLAMLGHELRSPLAPIRNVAEILARLLHDEPTAQRPLGILKRQTDQLTWLVDDLLDIARIQEGRMALEERPVEIGGIIEQAVETVQPLLKEKQQRLSVGPLAAPVLVLGDPARLVQCVVNLLDNAAKYTEPGGEVRIEVRESGARVSIAISDNGAGISPALLPHIFDPFVQSEETLEHARGGLGIGLAIVRHLVGMHGGSVEAASEGAGRGSSFTIHLWRLESAAAGAAGPA